jgi:hypothetical protein
MPFFDPPAQGIQKNGTEDSSVSLRWHDPVQVIRVCSQSRFLRDTPNGVGQIYRKNGEIAILAHMRNFSYIKSLNSRQISKESSTNGTTSLCPTPGTQSGEAPPQKPRLHLENEDGY